MIEVLNGSASLECENTCFLSRIILLNSAYTELGTSTSLIFVKFTSLLCKSNAAPTCDSKYKPIMASNVLMVSSKKNGAVGPNMCIKHP